MRKFYITNFKKETQFVKKNSRDKLVEKLHLFVEESTLFKVTPNCESVKSRSDLSEELILCLGSIFYSKFMKQFYSKRENYHEKIDLYHRCVYHYTYN